MPEKKKARPRQARPVPGEAQANEARAQAQANQASAKPRTGEPGQARPRPTRPVPGKVPDKFNFFNLIFFKIFIRLALFQNDLEIAQNVTIGHIILFKNNDEILIKLYLEFTINLA